MAVRNRDYFFDTNNNDRFNSRDIPKESTMLDWSDSVPFIKEKGDAAQLTRAGIAKTTTDAKVNARDDTDSAGVSPLGFTTFVTPSQLFKLLSSDSSITITKVVRGGTGPGSGIEDLDIKVNFPTIAVPTDTTDLVTGFTTDIKYISGTVANCSQAVSTVPVNSTDTLDNFLLSLKNNYGGLVEEFKLLADKVCAIEDTTVDIGDVVMTTTPPTKWNGGWLEPKGQLLTIAAYPELFAQIGNVYGGDGIADFKLPDLVSDNRYLRAVANLNTVLPLGAVGGSNTVSLVEANLPEHSHAVTGSTTTTGAHSHPLNSPTNNTGAVNNTVRVGSNVNNATSNTDANTGDHSHNISGTTDTFGANPVTPVAVTPEYQHVYLKIKVK